jgi:hypothetical protein
VAVRKKLESLESLMIPWLGHGGVIDCVV